MESLNSVIPEFYWILFNFRANFSPKNLKIYFAYRKAYEIFNKQLFGEAVQWHLPKYYPKSSRLDCRMTQYWLNILLIEPQSEYLRESQLPDVHPGTPSLPHDAYTPGRNNVLRQMHQYVGIECKQFIILLHS